MDIWEELRKGIERTGIHVPERLALLTMIREENGVNRLRERLMDAQRQLDETAMRLRKEAMGR